MVLDDLAVFVEAAGHATRNIDLFLGVLPETPSECIALTEYAGDQPLRNQADGAARTGAQGGERPRVQLIVRSETYSAGRALIQAVWQTLDGIVNETINGTFYVRCQAMQSPFLLRKDDNNRDLFAANFQIAKHVG